MTWMYCVNAHTLWPGRLETHGVRGAFVFATSTSAACCVTTAHLVVREIDQCAGGPTLLSSSGVQLLNHDEGTACECWGSQEVMQAGSTVAGRLWAVLYGDASPVRSYAAPPTSQ